jgi:hypothetical protein
MAVVYSASSVLIFVIGLVVSTIVIYFVSRFVGTKRGLKVAFFTAIIGSLIYAIVYFLVGNGLLAAVLGGIAWLLALKGLYKIGWIHALIMAIIIWIITSLVGVLLPTAPGPV